MGSGKETLSQEGEQSQTIPSLAHLKLPLRDNIPKIPFKVTEGGWFIFSSCFELTRGCRSCLSGILPLSYLAVPGDLNSDICCMNLQSSLIKIVYGCPILLQELMALSCRGLVLKTLILEEINPVSKSKRHDPSVNTDRRTKRGPVRCITQGNRSQDSNNIFQRLKD
jgi:hypothetical protein